MQAYSPASDTHYDDWGALVEAEANGYVVVVIVSKDGDKRSPWPWIEGPYPDEAEALKAKARMKTRFNREAKSFDPRFSARYFVRPAWKDPR